MKPLFPNTPWTVIADAKDLETSTQQHALTELCQAYYQPVLAIFLFYGLSKHDAEDRAQDFFDKIINGQLLENISKENGKFRSYLLRSLKNFHLSELKKQNAQKRGKDFVHIDLDQFTAIEGQITKEDDEKTVFDKIWAQTLINNALQQLENEFSRAKKQALYNATKEHLFGKGKPHHQLAEELNMSTRSITMTIYRMRKQFGEIMCEEVKKVVADTEDVEDEIRYLISVIS